MTTSRRSGPARWWRLRAGALVMGMALLTSSCYTWFAENHEQATPQTRPYYCNAVGDGTPPGGHGNGSHVHPIYQGMTKGPLGWEDCLKLGNQLDLLLASVWGMWTRSAGEAAGWREVAHYIPGLGTHHTKGFFPGVGPISPGTTTTTTAPAGSTSSTSSTSTSSTSVVPPPPATFDPMKPQFLIYGGTSPDSPLIGVAYAARGGSNPPEAFAGNNDWWHLHQKICISGQPPNIRILAGAEEIPDEECVAQGGRQVNLGPGIWLLHVWMVPNYQLKYDIFSSGHPCLGETDPLPEDDPCWETYANHDPADGPLPGMEDDHDGGHGGGHHAPDPDWTTPTTGGDPEPRPHDQGPGGGSSSTVAEPDPTGGTSSTITEPDPTGGTSSTVAEHGAHDH